MGLRVFIDLFSQRALAGRVWVECLWIDFLWLLHLSAYYRHSSSWLQTESLLCSSVGVIFVTAFLPHDMCTPQGKDFCDS